MFFEPCLSWIRLISSWLKLSRLIERNASSTGAGLIRRMLDMLLALKSLIVLPVSVI